MPPKDCVSLFAVQKWCISENLKSRFTASTWVLGALHYAPKGCPVKFYGQECWDWAVVGSDS
jgi:hypothetical protein